MKKRTIALFMAAVMLFGVTVGGTIAWLTAEATEVVNTFTIGDIQIKLDEADVDDSDNDSNTTERDNANEYQMIPGTTYEKDPKVTVLANSEDCYVYIKVKEENNTISVTKADGMIENQSIIQWTLGKNWLEIDETNKIYVYASVSADETKTPAIVNQSNESQMLGSIIMGDTIIINENLTNDMMNANGFKTPVLTFDAYAVQAANMGTENTMEAAVAAWNATFGATTSSTTN